MNLVAGKHEHIEHFTDTDTGQEYRIVTVIDSNGLITSSEWGEKRHHLWYAVAEDKKKELDAAYIPCEPITLEEDGDEVPGD